MSSLDITNYDDEVDDSISTVYANDIQHQSRRQFDGIDSRLIRRTTETIR